LDSDRRFVFKQDGNDSFTAGPKLGNDVDESGGVRSGVLNSAIIPGSRRGDHQGGDSIAPGNVI
jgi:hypothetical protein